ncbi:guanylate kinase [Neocloeon triangulifer]|uniref:guanylate kinase n=1 Tax=Neocloeon triangulifer TaxID=2078957 RepID=UPI00286EBE32|nr:guanylate kinase [Neocloeon triangulifer]XP_059482757.1 guanylate kinase [Neocloeon triangulifer]XP_059482758.1 guanylate kinase [Neocloeon triangulifer]XP_059482759.1 guanylate kinase [Neocloeon triangulifer]XP_059482760.1 guanylate kinase [Neocloeon triangulifer]
MSSFRVLVICGPSGAGKSTLVTRLMSEFTEAFGFSVSHTTRKPRPGEKDGVHYHYVSLEEMQAAVQRGEFLESATFSGNMYGTSKRSVEDVIRRGRICILDIDVQGVRQIKQVPDFRALYVFVKPPSLEALEARLRGRNTETDESLARRLKAARAELVFGETTGNFDLVMVNDNLDKSYEKLRTFLLPHVKALQSEGLLATLETLMKKQGVRRFYVPPSGCLGLLSFASLCCISNVLIFMLFNFIFDEKML